MSTVNDRISVFNERYRLREAVVAIELLRMS